MVREFSVRNPVASTGRASALAATGERPASLDRAHPNRQHPRPSRSASAAVRSRGAASRPVDGGTGQAGDGTSPPPVTTPPVAAPVARVQVPSVNVRVKPPALLGRDLPEARAETPAVTVDVPRLTARP